MATIAEIRSKYPQYQDMSDQQLGDALYAKYYSDMPRADFDAKVGLAPAQQRIPIISDFNDFSNAFRTGATEGMTFGFGDELQAGVEAIPRAIGDAFSGRGFDLGRSYGEGLDNTRKVVEDQKAKNPIAATVGDVTGSLVTAGGLGKAGLSFMNGARATIPSIMGRAAAEGAAYGGLNGFGRSDGNMVDRLVGAGTGAGVGGVLGGAGGLIGGAIAGKVARKAVPSVAEKEAAASAQYGIAEASGVVIPPPATAAVATAMRRIATSEGIISPTGRMSTSYPRIAEVLKTFDDYAGGTMTVPQMQAVRKTLTDAAKSAEPGEARVAMQMLNKFDGVTDVVAPTLKEGNKLYHQAKKGEMIETAIELAKAKMTQYSQSGFENALRNEFRALETKIIRGQIKGLTKEEIDAIKKVAHGGTIENISRYIGKAAPTGAVSFIGGGGVPFMIGNAFGGPVAGSAAAGAVMGTGFLGKSLATALAKGNVANASAVLRNGGRVLPSLGPAQAAALQAAIAGSGSESPRLPAMLPKIPIQLTVTGGNPALSGR